MKTRYTINQHFAFGNILKQARTTIQDELINNLQKSYPLASPEIQATDKVLKAIEQLKCLMDDTVCRENPHAANHEILPAYYGEPNDLLNMEGFAVIDVVNSQLLAGDDKDTAIFPTAEEAHFAGQALGRPYQITDLSTAAIVR